MKIKYIAIILFYGFCNTKMTNGQTPNFVLTSPININGTTVSPTITQGTYYSVSITATNNGPAGNYDFECDFYTSSGGYIIVVQKQCTQAFTNGQTRSISFSSDSPMASLPGSYEIGVKVLYSNCNGCGTSSCSYNLPSGGYANPRAVTVTSNTSCTSPTASVNSPTGTGTVTMSCTASGGSGGAISYKWYSGTSCSGTVLGTSSTYSTSTSGSYSCKAYIGGYESTCYTCAPGTATVNTTSCTSPTASVNSPTGTGTVTMTCTASGGSGGAISYKWFNGTSCSGTVLGTSSTYSTSTSGSYSCKAYISGYESTCYTCAPGTATVNTTSCTSPTASVNSPTGTGTVTMTCTASGGSGGAISYKWYSGTSCSGTVLGTSSTYSTSTSGSYSCKAYIGGYESTCYTCAPGTATVNTTSCTSPTASVNSPTGTGTVTMTCTASGGSGGAISYKWFNGTSCSGTVLGTSSTYSTSTSGSYSCKAYISGYESTCYTCAPGTATVNSSGPSGTITSTLGHGYFIEGVFVIDNKFTVTGQPLNTTKVVFYANGVNQSGVSNGTGGWTATFDMGTLPTNTISLYADYYNGNTLVGNSPDYSLNIIPKPWWLNSVTLNNVVASGGKINMDVNFPLQSFFDFIPSNIKGFNGKNYSITNNVLTFQVSFDMASRTSDISGTTITLLVDLIDQLEQSFDITFLPPTNFSLDKNFNLSATISKEIETPTFSLDLPEIEIEIEPPFISASVDAGFSISGTLKAQLVIGQDGGGQWGFIDNGDRTKITAKILPSAFIRGEIKLLTGAVSGEATLDVNTRIGGGFEFLTVPSVDISPLFGGDIDIYGTAKIKGAWGFITLKTYGPQQFYHDNFGDDINSFRLEPGTYIIPDNFPQPCLATRDNNLYAVWVENNLNTGYLCFSRLANDGNKFLQKIIVANNNNSITNPKITLMPDSSAFITWTQNRYSQSTLPNGISLIDALKGQDNWYAIYDSHSNSIANKLMIDDDTTTFQSGRLDGEATAAFGNSTGMVTWVVANVAAGGSDIWYSELYKSSNQWILSKPNKLSSLSGSNSNVNVAFTDGVNAIAVWINEPDAKDSTRDSKIVYSEWNGSSWSFPKTMGENIGTTNFNEVSIASNANQTVIAYTLTDIFGNDKFNKRLNIGEWDNTLKKWTTQAVVNDSVKNVYKPTVSISDKGIGTVIYQSINRYADTSYADPGELFMYVKDLNTNNPWIKITDNKFLCDTSAYIWELTSGFGSSNRFYTLTQEYDGKGIISNPINGVMFGDPNLSLVLRGLQINNDLTISDISEPNVPTGVTNKTLNEFELMQNYPNPFNKQTQIQFNLNKAAFVTLDIYDVTERKVINLVNSDLSQGIYQATFNADKLETGVYFYKLTVGNNSVTKKMVLIK